MLKEALVIGREVASRYVSADDAEDYASVVATELFEDTQKQPGFQPEDLEGFVAMAIRRRIVDAHKARKARGARAAKYQTQLEEDHLDRQQAAQFGDATDRAQLAQDALDALPRRCGQVFLLVKRDGMSYEEVAAELGISVSAVNKYLCNANKVLRETIAKARAGHRLQETR